MKNLGENTPYLSLLSLNGRRGLANASLIDRARAYVAKMPEAIAGSGGSAATFAVAKALVHDFGLPSRDGLLIMQEYNTRCRPHWTEAELQHKLDDAAVCSRAKRPKGVLSQQQVDGRSCFSRPSTTREANPPRILGYFRGTASRVEGSLKAEPAPLNGVQTCITASPAAVNQAPLANALAETVQNIEAKRIAVELAKLRQDGAITGPSDEEATFYAWLVRDFGATYTGRTS